MRRNLRALCALAVAAAAACSRQPQLPVSASGCEAVSSPAPGLAATVRNDADRPVRTVRVIADFYTDFRYVHVSAATSFPGGLDPGKTARAAFTFDSAIPPGLHGQALKCVTVRAVYLDGTSQDLPPVR